MGHVSSPKCRKAEYYEPLAFTDFIGITRNEADELLEGAWDVHEDPYGNLRTIYLRATLMSCGIAFWRRCKVMRLRIASAEADCNIS